MKQFFAATLLALSLAACGDGPSHSEDHTVTTVDGVTSAEVVVNGDTTLRVTLTDGYVMPPLKGRDVAAGFFEISNQGEEVGIVAASSPLSENVEVHTHLMEDGVMKMREVDRIAIPAGETVLFEPGSYHLMMFGFSREEGVSEAPVSITFDNGETLDLTFPIRER